MKPKKQNPKKHKKLPVYIDEEIFVKLISNLISRHHKIACLLAFESGLRISEVTGLKKENFDFKNNRIKVINGKGGKDRWVMLPRDWDEDYIDFIVMGDGDSSFYNLVKAIENNTPYSKVKGICYKDGRPITNPPAELEDLNQLEEFPYHLIDIERYITIKDGRRKFIIFTSRGCPYNCTFCYNGNKFNKGRWRAVSAENIIKHIEMLRKKYGITYIGFMDDEFWVDKKRVERFVELLKDMDIHWMVYGATIMSLKYITPEKAKEFAAAGLKHIICGIETLSPKLQRLTNKAIRQEHFYHVNKVMSDAGIKMSYSFMSGFPKETNEDIMMNVNAMLRIKKDYPQNDAGNIKQLVYYPATKIYDYAIQKGFKAPKTLEGWSNYTWHNDRLDYRWITKKRKRQLQNLYFATMLLNPDYSHIDNKLWRIVCNVSMPITKWRLRHLNFGFSPILFMLRSFKRLNLI